MDERIITTKEKVLALYEFTKELNTLKQKIFLSVKDYPWSKPISAFPNDPVNIEVHFRDRTKTEDGDDVSEAPLLKIRKPEFEKCPQPEDSFASWLQKDWEFFRVDAAVKPERAFDKTGKEVPVPVRRPQEAEEPAAQNGENGAEAPAEAENREDDLRIEKFEDDPQRVEEFNVWLEKRSTWQERQMLLDQTRKLFNEFYQQYIELERAPESLEMVAANGFIRDKTNNKIDQALLTRRVKIAYNAQENEITVDDASVPSELYSMLFNEMPDINKGRLQELREELMQKDYHPLDRYDAPDFLMRMIRHFSADSFFSRDGVPANWDREHRYLMYCEPTYIVRKRLDGTLKAIDRIIENINTDGYIPEPICEIVSGGEAASPEPEKELSVEEKLAEVGGENPDVLLCKPANKEQLDIAKRIEHYNAVLVQGPPGTGKTHTIANLMGHFMAQGKTVLVTSYTSKALRVLKDKVEKNLQNLCVTVLDDSNLDMVRSVDGITDFINRHTSREMLEKMQIENEKRKQIIRELSENRKKLFSLIHQEYKSIVLNGSEISPSEAASFVLDHAEDLSYIPGEIKADMPLPLSYSELADLYRSNEGISEEEEKELRYDIPPASLLPSVPEMQGIKEEIDTAKKVIGDVRADRGWAINENRKENKVEFKIGNKRFTAKYSDLDALRALREYLDGFPSIDGWMIRAAVDGKKGGASRKKWDTLIESIEDVYRFADSTIEKKFGKELQIKEGVSLADHEEGYKKIWSDLAQSGKLSFFTKISGPVKEALNAVKINDREIQTADECAIILNEIELQKKRTVCSQYWADLFQNSELPAFFDLDDAEPERIAYKYIAHIRRYLGWYANDCSKLEHLLAAAGIQKAAAFYAEDLDSDAAATKKILHAVQCELPAVCDVLEAEAHKDESERKLSEARAVLTEGSRGNSDACFHVLQAIEKMDLPDYARSYEKLGKLHQKYTLQNQRSELLSRLKPAAPLWAQAIEHREGIHGDPLVPETIEDAWKWKQLKQIIDRMSAEPFDEIQEKCKNLSREYRQSTAKSAEYSAWYHLLQKTDADLGIKQALVGWKQDIKAIGRGNGKPERIARLRKAAQEKMAICQKAVPAWIMPLNRALESLDPMENRFDIVIIDEASQADISSLAILYMGKKLIIVGDDKQVSPMAIGAEDVKIRALQDEYITGRIPNAELYDPKRSIYDVALTTFQPLMLREHFRCVPEIIGFSNMLSYDNRIKPLRDAGSSNLVPAVVNYRVADGRRNGNRKTNEKEALAIVSLMKACMEQPEYEGKTFGVISMLGDDQVKLLQKRILEMIDPQQIECRQILWGNSANFQGDERDVIFLSLVDSNDEEHAGPLRRQEFGPDESMRKRYNVAASRAKDQLWVVDSLDAANDLQPGDLRKRLIDYSLNPKAYMNQVEAVREQSESPFEEGVASALVARGYRVEQQVPAGAYRLDMVVSCGDKKIVIECDGERWHSSETQIRQDMERQTILERIGWRFIRIRGSEYFRNPEKTIDRIAAELNKRGIEPEDAAAVQAENLTSELLERVKRKAEETMRRLSEVDDKVGYDDALFALNENDTAKTAVNPVSNEPEKPVPKEPSTRAGAKKIRLTPHDPGKKRIDRDPRIHHADEMFHVGQPVSYAQYGNGTITEILRTEKGPYAVIARFESPIIGEKQFDYSEALLFLDQISPDNTDPAGQKASFSGIITIDADPFKTASKDTMEGKSSPINEASEKKEIEPITELRIGMKVRNKEHGIGTITAIEDEEEKDRSVEIDFPDGFEMIKYEEVLNGDYVQIIG